MGRTLFIAATTILILLSSFERPVVVTAAVDALNSILMILFGTIMAFSFSTSIFETTDTLGWDEARADGKRLASSILMRFKGMLLWFRCRKSDLSFVSIILALTVLVAGLILLFATGVMLSHNGDKLPDTLTLIWELYSLASIGSSFVGIVLGVISLLKENSKFLAIVGVCLNGLTLLLFVLLFAGFFT